MEELTEIPLILRGDPIFEKLFQIARLSNLNKKEMDAYTRNLIDRITLNVMYSRFKEEGMEEGRKEGREKGKEEGKTSFVINLLRETKFGIQKIAALAGVSPDFVKEIAASHS